MELVPNAFYIVGVDVGRNVLKALVMNLDGTIISKKMSNTGNDTSPEVIIDWLVCLIDETITDSHIDKEKIIGMGKGTDIIVVGVNGDMATVDLGLCIG